MTEHNVFTYARFLEAANPKTGQRRLRALAQLLLKKGCNSYADDHLAFALTSNKNLPRAVFAELGAEYPCGAVNNPYYVNHVLGAARQEDTDYLRGFDKEAKELGWIYESLRKNGTYVYGVPNERSVNSNAHYTIGIAAVALHVVTGSYLWPTCPECRR